MTISTDGDAGTRQGRSRLMTAVTPAAVLSAASGYVVLLLAARSLGAERYEVFAVYWAVFFAVVGVITGLSNETTRSVYSHHPGERRVGAVRPFTVGVALGLGAAALVWATSPFWAERLIPGLEHTGVLLIVLGVASLGPQAAVTGILAGMQRWSHFALVMVLDAALRLGAAFVAAASGRPEEGFLAATVAGSVAWILVMVLPVARSALGATGDTRTRRFVRRTGHAMWAGAATAVLIVGFPALIKATAPDADERVLSTLILALTLTRAPLLMPVTLFQSALVMYLVRRREDLLPLVTILVSTAVVALGGAGLAWVAGPTLMDLMGEGFVASGGTLALLTLSAGVLAMTLVSGYAALAHERHAAYAVGWWLAVVVAVAVLLLPVPLEARVVWALVVGPGAGLCYHLLAVARSVADRRRRP